MKRICLLCFTFFVFVVAATAQKGQWTLQQCIDSALARNILVRQRSLQTEEASVRNSQARAFRLPGVSASVQHGSNQGRSIDPFTNGYVTQQNSTANYQVGGQLVLFNGLTVKNNIRQTAYAADAARMDQQQERDDLTLNVILAYLQVLNNEDQATIAKAQLAVTQQQVARLEKLNKEGAISPPVLYDLRGQMKGEELNVVNAANAVQTAKLNLLQLMNLSYDSTMAVARDGAVKSFMRYPATADAVYEAAIAKMAVVKAAELRKQSAEAAVKVAKGQLYPTVSLDGSMFSNYSSVARKDNLIGASEVATDAYVVVNGGKAPVMVNQNKYTSQKILYPDQIKNNVYTNVGIGVRLPLLNALQMRNNIKLARISVKSAELVAENTRLQLRQAIDEAYLAMTNSWERYKVTLEQVAAYAESFRAAEVRFNAGVGTITTYSIDYLLAKARLDQASLNLVVARYDYVLRTKVLDYYNGNP